MEFYTKSLESNHQIHSTALDNILYIIGAFGLILAWINFKWLDGKIQEVIDSKANPKLNELEKRTLEANEVSQKVTELLTEVENIKYSINIKSAEYENIVKDLEEEAEKLRNKPYESFTAEDKRKLDLIATELNNKKDKTENDLFLIALEYDSNGEYHKAINEYEKIIEKNKNHYKAMNNIGSVLSELASISKDKVEKEGLYYQSIEKYKEAIEISANVNSYHGWALALSELASLNNDESLYRQSFEKFEEALKLDSNNDNVLNVWGMNLSKLAILNSDENLYRQSFEKYAQSIELNPNNKDALNNWGLTLSKLANLNNDENLYRQSFEKFEEALKLDSNNDSVLNNWGASLSRLAILNNNESLYRQSFEKYEQALKLNPNNKDFLSNWGLGLSKLANLNNDESLYEQSFEKFEEALKLDSNNDSLLNNWGTALSSLAQLKNNNQDIFEEAQKKYQEAFDINGKSYNLACIHALQKNKEVALDLLEITLKNNEIDIEHIKDDLDWDNYKEDTDFNKILNRYDKKKFV